MKTNKGKVIPEISLELMDWKQVEQGTEAGIRKHLIDSEISDEIKQLVRENELRISKKVRELAKRKIVELGGKTSEQEKEETRKQINTIDG